jgi:Domain of unknown function (DUF4845)
VPTRRSARSMRDGERGAGNLKAIVWTLILAMMIYAGVKVVPVLIDEYQFQDSIQTIARFASANRQSVEQIRKDVANEALKNNLPIAPEDIHIEARNGNIKINADYSVMVDLKVYQWTLNFHPAASNSALF